MKLDFRWIVISCVELIAVVAFLTFAGTNSWSSSESSWALIALLLVFMLVNETIDRLARHLSRRRGVHR
jgi:Zn-dependent protease with chaperone function